MKAELVYNWSGFVCLVILGVLVWQVYGLTMAVKTLAHTELLATTCQVIQILDMADQRRMDWAKETCTVWSLDMRVHVWHWKEGTWERE